MVNLGGYAQSVTAYYEEEREIYLFLQWFQTPGVIKVGHQLRVTFSRPLKSKVRRAIQIVDKLWNRHVSFDSSRLIVRVAGRSRRRPSFFARR